MKYLLLLLLYASAAKAGLNGIYEVPVELVELNNINKLEVDDIEFTESLENGFVLSYNLPIELVGESGHRTFVKEYYREGNTIYLAENPEFLGTSAVCELNENKVKCKTTYHSLKIDKESRDEFLDEKFLDDPVTREKFGLVAELFSNEPIGVLIFEFAE